MSERPYSGCEQTRHSVTWIAQKGGAQKPLKCRCGDVLKQHRRVLAGFLRTSPEILSQGQSGDFGIGARIKLTFVVV
jgi:hypothetical protein